MAVRLGRQDAIITIDGVDYSTQLTNVEIRSAAKDSGQVTFGGASGSSRQYSVAMTFIQTTGTDTLLDMLWAHSGDKVDISFRPAGGSTTAAADNPIYTAELTVSDPDGVLVGGSASVADDFTTSVEWLCTDKPVRATS